MRTSNPTALFTSSAILTLVVACSSSTTPPPSGDGGTSFDGSVTVFDAGPILDSGSNDADPPSSAGSCTPAPGSTGNSKNVGAYCTKSGGQCSGYANPNVQCSIDLSAQGSNFCILIGCSADTDCGEDACCTGQAGNPIHACVPNQCFDGGVCQGIPQ